MSEWSGDEGTPTQYGRWQWEGGGDSGGNRVWMPDDVSQAVKGNVATPFDMSQVASMGGINYEGNPSEYYDKSGNLIGFLGRNDQIQSTSGYNFIDNSGKPITGNLTRGANVQQTDDQGNLLWIDPNDEGRVTLRNTGVPAAGSQLTSFIKRNAPQGTESLLQDPLFRNFMLSAGAMAGAAALAPTMAGGAAEAGTGALGGGGWEGSSAMMDAVGQGSAPLAGAGGAGSALTAADALKYAQYGMKGLGALQSLAGMAGGQGGQGGQGQQMQGGSPQALINPNGPWNTFLQPSIIKQDIVEQKPIMPNTELASIYGQLDPYLARQLASAGVLPSNLGSQQPANYYTYGSMPSVDNIFDNQSQPLMAKKGGSIRSEEISKTEVQGETPAVLAQAMQALPTFKDGNNEHIPEFITGATGHYVKGRGDGQSDEIPAMLADSEYVFDADTVAALGNGSSDAGAKVLDKMREAIRAHKRSAPNDEIPPKAKSPLEYIKEGMKRK